MVLGGESSSLSTLNTTVITISSPASLIRTSQADARQKIAKSKKKTEKFLCIECGKWESAHTPTMVGSGGSRRDNELNALQCHRHIQANRRRQAGKQLSHTHNLMCSQTQTRTTRRTMLSTNQPTSATSNGKTVSAAGKLTFYFCSVVLLACIFVCPLSWALFAVLVSCSRCVAHFVFIYDFIA